MSSARRKWSREEFGRLGPGSSMAGCDGPMIGALVLFLWLY